MEDRFGKGERRTGILPESIKGGADLQTSGNEKPKKKIPERKCTGCGESMPKNRLLRVVRSPEGEISLDFTGKKSGRGAYVCKNSACLKKARKAKRLERNLECVIPDSVYDALEAEMESTETQ